MIMLSKCYFTTALYIDFANFIGWFSVIKSLKSDITFDKTTPTTELNAVQRVCQSIFVQQSVKNTIKFSWRLVFNKALQQISFILNIDKCHCYGPWLKPLVILKPPSQLFSSHITVFAWIKTVLFIIFLVQPFCIKKISHRQINRTLKLCRIRNLYSDCWRPIKRANIIFPVEISVTDSGQIG